MKENMLWYDSPAQDWYEAAPLGNGKLGMMVFGGVTEDRIQLNEETFWSGWECPEFDNPETAVHLDEMRRLIFEGKYTDAQALCNRYMVCRGQGHHDPQAAYGSYQTAGDLYITFPDTDDHTGAGAGAGAGYRRTLTLDEGLVEVCNGDMKREYFVSLDYNTAVIRIRNCPEGTSLRYARENTTIICDPGEIFALGALPTRFAVVIRYAREDADLCVYITAATNYKSDADPLTVCRETLDRAQAAGFDALMQGTKDHFASLLHRAEITFPQSGSMADVPTNQRIAAPDGDLGLVELYYNFGRYLLVSSSFGKLPANLQGIWCKDYRAPWSADYHININIQMNYWFAEVCDLPELLPPFFNLIKSLVEPGQRTARISYNCPGWVSHFGTTPWGYTSLGCSPVYGAFTVSGAWCLRHVKERWLYSGDKSILEEFYPIIKGSSEFFLAYLVRDPRNGYLVTAPASSPENSFVSPNDGSAANVSAGPTMDTSIIRELFEFNAEAARTLGRDENFARKLDETVAQLPPLCIGKHGQIMEWSEDFDEAEPGHRHISHLYGLHPAAQIRKSTPELFEAARKSIERRLAHGGGHTGWSRAWIINFFARLADGNSAYQNIVELIRRSTLPNMFDNHPPFQIDGNFGGTAGIAEMLLQSHDDCIDVLPALPDAWTEGEFKGFKARGGFTVSAKWQDSRVVNCRIEGKDGTPIRARINGELIEAVGSYTYQAQ